MGAGSGAGRVLPDTEDNPEPVPVVIQGKVGLPSDEDSLERQLCDGNLVADSSRTSSSERRNTCLFDPSCADC